MNDQNKCSLAAVRPESDRLFLNAVISNKPFLRPLNEALRNGVLADN